LQLLNHKPKNGHETHEHEPKSRRVPDANRKRLGENSREKSQLHRIVTATGPSRDSKQNKAEASARTETAGQKGI
jgi:hypothetical protein